MAETQSKAAKLIARRHPKYGDYEGLWTFFLESYLGGQKYIDKNLFQYLKEGDEEFKQRKERAYRENHTKRVVDLILSYLFKEVAERQSDNSYVEKLWVNFDGKGKSVYQFMKAAALFSSVFGRVYIVCDKLPLPKERATGTQLDNLNPEAMPYCYLVYPGDVLDIAFDGVKNILWALILERKRDDEDPYLSTGDVKERYRLWLPGEWILFDDHANEIDRGKTNLGRVPIVILDSEEQDDYTGQSIVSDIAYLDRSIMNNWSRLDVIVNDQTFSQLIFPVEGLPADIVNDKKLRDEFLTLATNRILLYSAQAQAAPQFISPDATQADFILRMIEQQVKQLYASIGLQAETATEVSDRASGVAKAYDFEKVNKLLAGKADNCEEAEKEILEIFRGWMGGIDFEAKIDYPDEFDTRSLFDEIELAQELTALGISETFTKELHKSVAEKIMPKADERVMEKIKQEIDAKDLEKEEMMKQGIFDFDHKQQQRQLKIQSQAQTVRESKKRVEDKAA